MEKAWATTKIYEYHVELQVLKRRVEDLNFTLETADQDVVETQAYMDGNGIPLSDLVEEVLDEQIALSK